MCQRSSYRTRGGDCGFHGPVNQGGNRGGDSASYQRAHREADRGIPAATDRRNNRGGASASGAHPRAQCGADTGIHNVSDQRENSGMNSRARGADSGTPVPQVEAKIAEVFQVLSQQRIHEHIVDPCFPRSAVVGSDKRVILAVVLRRSFLSGDSTRTRRGG